MASSGNLAPSIPSLAQGRLLILGAAILWSLSGGFTKALTQETRFGLNHPELTPLLIAMARVLSAGLILLPMLRQRDLSFQPMMLVMVASFATMNALFVTAMARGTAANTILLQYSAPFWMFGASVLWLKEKADIRSLFAVALGSLGIAIIVVGGWKGNDLPVVAMGLGSGLAYAAVLICLRVLRHASSRWLTTLNSLFSGLILIPFLGEWPSLTVAQIVTLFLFGSLQMGLPYWLVARGLRSVSPQEAGAITLLEPILNPIWAYLVSGEMPDKFTWIGGGFIVGALLWRYWPRDRSEIVPITRPASGPSG
jgi:drug/metabolite transporter (DMT)-like permease